MLILVMVLWLITSVKIGRKDNPMDQWIISTGGHLGVIPSDKWIQCQQILDAVKKKI